MIEDIDGLELFAIVIFREGRLYLFCVRYISQWYALIKVILAGIARCTWQVIHIQSVAIILMNKFSESLYVKLGPFAFTQSIALIMTILMSFFVVLCWYTVLEWHCIG